MSASLGGQNLRGIVLMVAAMGAFAVEDMLIKLASRSLPVGEILLALGLAGLAIFGAMAGRRGLPLLDRRALRPALVTRNLGEMAGTLAIVAALALAPLTVVTAIFQATPLAVTLAAATVLGERVGWRRWLAVGAGFAGVLVVIRPWGAAFEPAALLAVVAVVGLSARDIATRRVGRDVHTLQIAAWAMAAVALTGALLLGLKGGARLPDPATAALLLAAGGVGAVAYWLLTEANRTGEVSVIVPFRYARLLFATALGALAFGERPDLATILGSAMVVGAGLYGFARGAGAVARRAGLGAGLGAGFGAGLGSGQRGAVGLTMPRASAGEPS